MRRSFPIRLALAALGATLLLAGSDRAFAPDVAACVPIKEALPEVSAASLLDPAQQALVQHLSRRYVIDPDAAALMVSAAHRAAQEVGLDPLLVLAVISVESSFNPDAESGMGAKGLMQIIPKYHRAKLSELGGEEAVLDPEANIQVGARILQEYVHRRGTLEAGLQYYNGAAADGTAQYAQKVMAERSRLERVLRSAPSRRG
jgi:soluble lytic murein transglycosylase-like protein